MAKLVSFCICDSIENVVQGGHPVLKVVFPQVSLRPQTLPSNFSFGVVVGVIGVDIEKSNAVQFKVMAPNGEVVHDSHETLLPVAKRDEKLPEEWQGFMLCADVRNLFIRENGIYKFSFYVNGRLLEEHEVPIYGRE